MLMMDADEEFKGLHPALWACGTTVEPCMLMWAAVSQCVVTYVMLVSSQGKLNTEKGVGGAEMVLTFVRL